MIDKLRKLIIPPTFPFISDIDKLPSRGCNILCCGAHFVVQGI